jgi:sialate O-acetylesterase
MYRYPPRKYAVPPNIINEGENEIMLRVVVCNGLGEITPDKPFDLLTYSGEKLNLYGGWEYKIAVRSEPRPEELFLNREAFGLYNAMIYPAREYPVKGVLFYQAESNDKNPLEYESLFKALINDWRETRNAPQLPFIFAQLPIWGKPGSDDENDSWAILRDAQEKARSIPFTAMVVTLDTGEWNDLHPTDKKTVGERFFLAEEKLIFGDNNSSPGPRPVKCETKDGCLIITFENVADTLVAKGRVTLTLIKGDERREMEAVINGKESLCISLEGFSPERVLYAWANTPRGAGLFNSDGLPAAPFRAGRQRTLPTGNEG